VDPGWNRSRQSLIISDYETNYKEGILPFDKAKMADGIFWQQHVVQFKGKPTKDKKNEDSFYLNAHQKGGLWIRVDCACIVGAQSKDYVRGLFEDQISKGGDIHCYWWGLQPKETARSHGPFLCIDTKTDAMRIGFQAVPS
jgi:hypothetical protein